MGSTVDDETDVNMAADCRVDSLYDLAAFTTVRNCDVFKTEFRSLPNAVQCDIYRTVSISMFSVSFFSWFSSMLFGKSLDIDVYKICFKFIHFAAFFYVAFRHW